MITDDEIRAMVAESFKGRQNNRKRTMRKDAEAALNGSAVCREVMEHWRDARVLTLTIPPGLGDAIENYLNTDWSDGRDPSKIGALNAVAYLGEQLARIYTVANPSRIK